MKASRFIQNDGSILICYSRKMKRIEKHSEQIFVDARSISDIELCRTGMIGLLSANFWIFSFLQMQYDARKVGKQWALHPKKWYVLIFVANAMGWRVGMEGLLPRSFWLHTQRQKSCKMQNSSFYTLASSLFFLFYEISPSRIVTFITLV